MMNQQYILATRLASLFCKWLKHKFCKKKCHIRCMYYRKLLLKWMGLDISGWGEVEGIVLKIFCGILQLNFLGKSWETLDLFVIWIVGIHHWWRKWQFNLCLSCVSPSTIHGLHYNPLFKQCLQGWRDCSPCLFNRKFAILGPTTALFTGHQSNSIWSNAPQIFSIFIQYFPISFLRDFCFQLPKHHNSKSSNSSC